MNLLKRSQTHKKRTSEVEKLCVDLICEQTQQPVNPIRSIQQLSSGYDVIAVPHVN